MSDKSVQLVNPEDNSERQFPITLASLVGTNNNSNVETELGKKYEKPTGGIPASDIAAGVIPSSSSFKTVQTAVQNPSASGTGIEFVDSISQDTNGVITPHRKSVRVATESQSGLISASSMTALNAAYGDYSANILKIHSLIGRLKLAYSLVDGYFSTLSVRDLAKERNVFFYCPDNYIDYDATDGNSQYYFIPLDWNGTILYKLKELRNVPFRIHISFFDSYGSVRYWLRFLYSQSGNEIIRYIFNGDGSYQNNIISGTDAWSTTMNMQQVSGGNAYINIEFELTYLGLIDDEAPNSDSNPYTILVTRIN